MKVNRKTFIVMSILTLLTFLFMVDIYSGIFTKCILFYCAFIYSNVELFKALSVSLLTSFLVLIISTIIAYKVERSKLISLIWSHSSQLYQDFSYLILNNINADTVSNNDLQKIASASEFNKEIRAWTNYYSGQLLPVNSEFKLFFNFTKLYKDIRALQEDIAKISLLINSLNLIYVNSKVKNFNDCADINSIVNAIKRRDENKLFDTTQIHLDKVRSRLKIVKI